MLYFATALFELCIVPDQYMTGQMRSLIDVVSDDLVWKESSMHRSH